MKIKLRPKHKDLKHLITWMDDATQTAQEAESDGFTDLNERSDLRAADTLGQLIEAHMTLQAFLRSL